ncbi:MAG TPA: low-specificity L-threonine aldolase [Alphaproteobacteria bacterium]|nr:low-specificity L-threonine aldolase [Alphaproteobacteria bacterium]
MVAIDLRSDTVTRPTEAMRAAMAAAEVGDDVYGEDTTVNRLESVAAERLGHESAVFVPSGTQSNLLALLSHCERGDEYIVGQLAHTYKYEGGGAAVLGSIQPQPIDFEPDGSLDLERVSRVIKPDNIHFARTRLLCLENTQAGKVLPLAYLDQAKAFVDRRGLALHLDGARVFNAAVKLGVPVDRITARFDSVSFCLSKGLGAPVGSVLCGGRDLIQRARRWRKVTGGGMRQAGVIAAAGIVALESHVERLAEDHANARALAQKLAGVAGLSVDADGVQTNMVFLSVTRGDSASFSEHMRKRGIFVSAGTPIRMVTHLDFHAEQIPAVIEAARAYFARAA